MQNAAGAVRSLVSGGDVPKDDPPPPIADAARATVEAVPHDLSENGSIRNREKMGIDETRNAEVALCLENVISEYEKRLHERRSADVKRCVDAGHHVSRVPIGYRRVRRDGEFFIEADPVQAPLVPRLSISLRQGGSRSESTR